MNSSCKAIPVMEKIAMFNLSITKYPLEEK